MHTDATGRRETYREFVRKKARRLILPYLVINSMAFPIKAELSRFAVRPVEFTVASYLKSLLYPWQNTIIFCWFLPTLFLIFLAAPVLLSACRSQRSLVVILVGTVLLGHLVWGDRLFWNDALNYRGPAMNAAYFWLGMLARKHRRQLSLLERWPSVGLAAALLIGVFSLGPKSGWASTISAVCGIVFSFGFAVNCHRLGWRILQFLDGRTFQIFLLSWFPQIFCKIVLGEILGLGFWLTSSAMFATGLCVPLLATHFIEEYCLRLKPVFGL